MRTNINYTNEMLGGYLMNNNKVNAEYLAGEIQDHGEAYEKLYNQCFNTRRKPRNVAIEWMMDYINAGIVNNGHYGYYATNQQVMKFDKEHGGLEDVLDILEANIKQEREDVFLEG